MSTGVEGRVGRVEVAGTEDVGEVAGGGVAGRVGVVVDAALVGEVRGTSGFNSSADFLSQSQPETSRRPQIRNGRIVFFIENLYW